MERRVSVDEGAEAFIELLNANGVDCIFINPGTDIYPIQEAVAKYKALGKRTPEVILCLHEQVAMAAAHGYFMITGKPQVVLVHVDVGLQQLGGSLHNALRGRIGVVLCAGQVPSTIEADKQLGRSSHLHWYQESFDPAGIVRGYVKWESELRSNENIHHVVQRAFQVASSEPCGPVFLSLPLELLREKITSVSIPAAEKYSAVSTPQVDSATLDNIADILVQSENPLIITGYSGRHTQSVESLVELAETLSARVVTSQVWMNFPTSHDLFAGFEPTPYLGEADAILIIDHDVPYVPANVKPGQDARIIHIDIDPLKQNMPMWGFPADFLVQADSSKTIPVLAGLIREKLSPERQKELQARRKQLKDEHQHQQDEWIKQAVSQATQKPISKEWVCRCIAEAIDDETILLEEPIFPDSLILHQIPRSKPGTLFHGGASLGWALGASVGTKLACPDKLVVSLMGDGCFVFGCPTATLWAAGAYKAPFLSVIFNNEQYAAPRKIIRRDYGPDSYSEKTGLWPGTEIKPTPDYALIAQACHAYGQVVTEPSELPSALKKAIEKVKSGTAAVLDVRIGATLVM